MSLATPISPPRRRSAGPLSRRGRCARQNATPAKKVLRDKNRRSLPRRAWLPAALLCAALWLLPIAGSSQDSPDANQVAQQAERLAQALKDLDGDPLAAAKALEALERDPQAGALAQEAGHFLTLALQRAQESDERQIAVLERLARRFPDSRHLPKWQQRYQALSGRALPLEPDLSSPAATWASLQRGVRMRDFEQAYACCSPAFQRAIPLSTFTRGVERSRAAILEARLASDPDDAGLWRVTDAQGRLLADIPFTKFAQSFTIDLGD